MLTALVRDLEKLHPKRFSIGVETQRRDLWKNNPYIEWELCRFGSDATDEGRDGEAEFMRVEYPLIHKSNQQPQRFIHAMHQFVGERLGLDVYPTPFKGDVASLGDGTGGAAGFPKRPRSAGWAGATGAVLGDGGRREGGLHDQMVVAGTLAGGGGFAGGGGNRGGAGRGDDGGESHAF